MKQMNTRAASGRKIVNGSCRLYYEVIIESVIWCAATAAPEFFSGTQNSVKVICHGTLRIAVNMLGDQSLLLAD
jgi:hypothetical protein